MRKDDRGSGGPPITRLLVANRGEIAVRIIRACREMGIESVAVYSEADQQALHVRLADQAVPIGPAPAAESYMRIDRIIETARATGAQAVHPGYGFLSERADLAGAVESAGLRFVGPSSPVIELLGNKLNARRLAASAGVPVVPGVFDPLEVGSALLPRTVELAASSIGYPLLVKAPAGGGGRGMRRVTTAAELPKALVAASAEAAAAFGDGTVYLEREIARARHVEVQLIGDGETLLAVGERECSIQRRHQKLVEEAPAPGLTPQERGSLHDLAVRLGRAAGLTNAATVEFLFTPEREFLFLEVNPRLQVEHGITELVSGVDLVQEQIRIAAGEQLSAVALAAADRAADPPAHAIEVRLTAEDPRLAFTPSSGQIRRLVLPGGPGVRIDAGIEAGDTVPPEYDNLLAKVMVVAPDRESAVARLSRAVSETEIAGIQTSLPFHRFVASSPAFTVDQLSTRWLEEHWDAEPSYRAAAERALVAGGLAVLSARTSNAHTRAADTPDGNPTSPPAPARGGPAGPEAPSEWRLAGRRAALDRWPR